MDKQNISRQLHRLAQEEIPDNMNLWPRIQGQLKRKSKPRSFSLAHALSVVVMLILVGVGGYAAYQSPSNFPDLVPPSDVTELALVQTVGGVTASVDWVYADAHIITVQYSILYNPNEVAYPDFSTVSLSTADGMSFPQLGGGGGGGGGNGEMMKFVSQANFDSSAITGNPETLDLLFQISFSPEQFPYASEFQPTVPPPDAIFITTATPFQMDNGIFVPTVPPVGSRVEISLEDMSATPLPPTVPPRDGELSTPIPMDDFQPTVPPNASFDLTATPIPMGDFQPTVPPPDTLLQPSLIPPMQFTPTPAPALPVNQLIFSFSVPFYPAKAGEIEEASIEANGLEVQLQNLRISPMVTSFELCYDLPDSQGDWYPKASVDTGFAPSPVMQFGMPMPRLDGESAYMAENLLNGWTLSGRGQESICAPMQSYAPFSPDGGKMEIIVDYLFHYADATDPAVWEADIAFFAERGFDLSYAFEPILRGEEAAFYSQPRPSNIMVYPIPEIGAVLVTIRDYPEQLEEWEAYSYLQDNMLKTRYEGPWVYEVSVE